MIHVGAHGGDVRASFPRQGRKGQQRSKRVSWSTWSVRWEVRDGRHWKAWAGAYVKGRQGQGTFYEGGRGHVPSMDQVARGGKQRCRWRCEKRGLWSEGLVPDPSNEAGGGRLWFPEEARTGRYAAAGNGCLPKRGHPPRWNADMDVVPPGGVTMWEAHDGTQRLSVEAWA